MTDPSAADDVSEVNPDLQETSSPGSDPADADEPSGSEFAAASAAQPEGELLEELPSAEELAAELNRVAAERDDYLNNLQRVTAEFANFRRKAAERQQDTVASAAAGLVEKMLPVLDACEAAVAQGADDVIPIWSALMDPLAKEGLVRLDELGAPFDPNRHEAVIHEPSDDQDGEPVVAEVLRTGYQWNDRVLRPAMVKVRG